MSDDIVIRAENLSKRYQISHLAGQETLRDSLHHVARMAWRRLRWNAKLNREDFWALRDVNFEIKRGEVVGIIGRNGAGKSTLLKILSRITEPTTGRITLKGRVASLLEVGTGFHPELTGRDNIFLNGAILGMSRVEIRRKFDEIVAFAEVERFIDTPVKRYSSGMYVRLAFAVAAHLEPEILIVDEVLAVGDAAFQKKCLGKLQTIATDHGRTVLFVSHNLGSIQTLCSRCLMLQQGSLMRAGTPAEVMNDYIKAGLETVHAGGFVGSDPALRIDRVVFQADIASPRIEIDVTVRSTRARFLALEFRLITATGLPVGFASAGSLDGNGLTCEAGETRARWAVEACTLAVGSYQVVAVLLDPLVQTHATVEHPVFIEVVRAALPPATRVLQQDWQVGHVELPASRIALSN